MKLYNLEPVTRDEINWLVEILTANKKSVVALVNTDNIVSEHTTKIDNWLTILSSASPTRRTRLSKSHLT